jgi:hypothetical protein
MLVAEVVSFFRLAKPSRMPVCLQRNRRPLECSKMRQSNEIVAFSTTASSSPSLALRSRPAGRDRRLRTLGLITERLNFSQPTRKNRIVVCLQAEWPQDKVYSVCRHLPRSCLAARDIIMVVGDAIRLLGVGPALSRISHLQFCHRASEI